MKKEILQKMLKFGEELLQKSSFEEGLPIISKYAKEILNSDRASLFVYNPHKDKLEIVLADGLEKIEIDKDKGVVGNAFINKKTIIENDVKNSPIFYSDVDKQTGYKTENLIATPILSALGKPIGVLELLNKPGGFNEEDKKIIQHFAHFASSFIEFVYESEYL